MLKYVAGVRQRAEALGYGVDELFHDPERLTSQSLTRILLARRIDGVVLLPTVQRLEFDWPVAAWACLGFLPDRPPLHAATSDYVFHAWECFERLAARGCRRIGLVQNQTTDIALAHEWLAGYAAAAFRHNQAPLVFNSPDPALTGVDRWLAATKLDGLISSSTYVAQFLAAARRPPAVVYLNLIQAHEGRPGMVEPRVEVGMSAVDLIVGQLHRGERGLPVFPTHVRFRGVWTDG